MPEDSKERSLPRASRGGVLFPSAIAVANFAIFLFQVMLARITTPALFGSAEALLAVMLILEAPSTSLQALLSRAVQRNRAEGSDTTGVEIGSLVGLALAGGVLVFALLAGVTIPLGHYLHLGWSPYLIAVYAIPLMLGVVPKGVLAGMSDYRRISVGLIVGSMVRLVAGTLLVHAGYGVEGALGAVVVGEAAASLLLLSAARRRTSGRGRPLRLAWRDAGGEGLAATGFWLLCAVDLVLARHYLPGNAAGEFAAAATLAQVVMILPGAAAAHFFPRLIGSTSTGSKSGSLLLRSLIAVAGLSLATAGLVAGFAQALLRLIFDRNYEVASTASLILLLSAASLGIVTVLIQYLLLRQEAVPASLSWVGAIALGVGVGLFHKSVTAVAIDSLVGSALTCVTMLAVAVHGCRYLTSDSASRPDLAALEADLDLTVVVPYYNPGGTLAPNLRRLLAVLEASSADFEIIAVSDGSTDGSEATITDLIGGRIRHVTLPKNQGKGAALRVGLAAGRGRYLGFIDADGDLDPQLLETFVALIDLYDPDVVVGSKRHPLSNVHYPPLRWVYSIGFQILTRLLFRLNVRDTQTGLKLLRRDVLAASLPRMLEKRFAFDLELLVVAGRLGYHRVLEAPVVLNHRFTSTISIRSVAHTLLDTLAIFYRLRFLRTYDKVPEVDGQELRLSPAFVRGGVGFRR